MPVCGSRCPLVRAQLRKVVAEAPWIRDEHFTSTVKVRETSAWLETADEKFQSSDHERDDRRQKVASGIVDRYYRHPEASERADVTEEWLDVEQDEELASWDPERDERKQRVAGDVVERRYRHPEASERADVTEKWLDAEQDQEVASWDPERDERKQRVAGDAVDRRYRHPEASERADASEKWLAAEQEKREIRGKRDRTTDLEGSSISTGEVSARILEERGVDPSLVTVSTKKTDTTRRLSDIETRSKAASATQSGGEVFSRVAEERGSVRETGTTRRLSDIGSDKLVETDIVEGTTRYVGDSTYELSERERMDRDASEREIMDERAVFTDLRDECDPTCPKSRLRKLEERQNTVDAYLLNKGARYFDDVCTCSLSCIVRSLSDDSFVISILTSVALFTLGLKLCSELDAWYLPTRFS